MSNQDEAPGSEQAPNSEYSGGNGMESQPIEAPTDAAGQTVHLEQRGAGDIRADKVTISQGGAGNIKATTVSISQGGAGRVTADQLTVNQGGVGLARTKRLTIEEGGTAFAVMADTATVGEGSSIFMLVARNTTGDVRPALDWRAAAALGAGLGLVLSLLRRARR